MLCEPQSGAVWKKKMTNYLFLKLLKLNIILFLLIFLQVGHFINVGKFIHSSPVYIIRGTTSIGSGHSFLIYGLYVSVGVRGDPSEE
ncbi:hypothetical protein IEQ34_001102 [Dendrobium chrysotoxum]|uniref:Uncharacterized protein n=1 Tax=Dendrobium chrysotoxum TaxID=161865 RepID=A0AAV7H6V0_DENCH|nr:hypothetical protein IEQ34_001102 [Dendrobium chrysotoxum]